MSQRIFNRHVLRHHCDWLCLVHVAAALFGPLSDLRGVSRQAFWYHFVSKLADDPSLGSVLQTPSGLLFLSQTKDVTWHLKVSILMLHGNTDRKRIESAMPEFTSWAPFLFTTTGLKLNKLSQADGHQMKMMKMIICPTVQTGIVWMKSSHFSLSLLLWQYIKSFHLFKDPRATLEQYRVGSEWAKELQLHCRQHGLYRIICK